jgi:hypothetical protein
MKNGFQPALFLTYRDMDVCTLPEGALPRFKARFVPVKGFHFPMALDMLVRIRRALDEGRQFVGVSSTGPIFQYRLLADMENALRIPENQVHFPSKGNIGTTPSGTRASSPSTRSRRCRWRSRA